MQKKRLLHAVVAIGLALSYFLLVDNLFLIEDYNDRATREERRSMRTTQYVNHNSLGARINNTISIYIVTTPHQMADNDWSIFQR